MIAVRFGIYYKQYLVTRSRSNLIFFMQFNELLEHSQRDTPYIFNVRNVFREFGDIHEERQVSTPPPEVMGVKMDNFIGKWKDACNSYGDPIFQADTYNALKNVMNHINMGCLRLVEEQIRMRDSISI